MKNKDLVKKLAIALSALIGGAESLNLATVSAMEAEPTTEQSDATENVSLRIKKIEEEAPRFPLKHMKYNDHEWENVFQELLGIHSSIGLDNPDKPFTHIFKKDDPRVLLYLIEHIGLQLMTFAKDKDKGTSADNLRQVWTPIQCLKKALEIMFYAFKTKEESIFIRRLLTATCRFEKVVYWQNPNNNNNEILEIESFDKIGKYGHNMDYLNKWAADNPKTV